MSIPAQDTDGRIVVGVDGSPSSEFALRWAGEQARLTGSELHAVITWEIPLSDDAFIATDVDWEGDASAALRKSVENVLGGPDAPPVVQHTTRGHPARVLTEESRDAGLLVVGSRGHGGVSGLLLGSVSRHVVGHAACPVVVVRGDRAPTGRIVVGVDGSAGSQHALRWAARQADLAGCSVQAVLAWQLPFGYGLVDRPESDYSAHAAHVLATAVTSALGEDGAATVTQEVVEGKPAEMLLDRAADADLLVVGSRGRGGFGGLLLGSVSQHAAAHSPCPVVVCHEEPTVS